MRKAMKILIGFTKGLFIAFNGQIVRTGRGEDHSEKIIDISPRTRFMRVKKPFRRFETMVDLKI
jgi:hypothetical protein